MQRPSVRSATAILLPVATGKLAALAFKTELGMSVLCGVLPREAELRICIAAKDTEAVNLSWSRSEPCHFPCDFYIGSDIENSSSEAK